MITGRDVVAQWENWAEDIAGSPVADTGYFSAAIYEQFLMSRSTVLAAELERDPSTVNKYSQQTLACLSLDEVSVESECPCAPPSGCTWFKTSLPIPIPIQLISVTAIGGNLSKLQNFTYSDWDTVKYLLGARISAERERGYYTIRNNHLYILGDSLKAISISGVFYDPVETQRHPLCGAVFSDCAPFLDFPLYIDPTKYQQMLVMTFQTIAGMSGTAKFDTSNNAQPTVGAEPIKPN